VLDRPHTQRIDLGQSGVDGQDDAVVPGGGDQAHNLHPAIVAGSNGEAVGRGRHRQITGRKGEPKLRPVGGEPQHLVVVGGPDGLLARRRVDREAGAFAQPSRTQGARAGADAQRAEATGGVHPIDTAAADEGEAAPADRGRLGRRGRQAGGEIDRAGVGQAKPIGPVRRSPRRAAVEDRPPGQPVRTDDRQPLLVIGQIRRDPSGRGSPERAGRGLDLQQLALGPGPPSGAGEDQQLVAVLRPGEQLGQDVPVAEGPRDLARPQVDEAEDAAAGRRADPQGLGGRRRQGVRFGHGRQMTAVGRQFEVVEVALRQGADLTRAQIDLRQSARRPRRPR
jgi:hypothetical protein